MFALLRKLAPFIVSSGLLLGLSVLLFVPNCFCDTIVLKSGKEIEGRIIEKTDNYIKVEVGGIPLYFEHKYIDRIEEVLSIEQDVSPREEEAISPSVLSSFKNGLELGYKGNIEEAEKEIRRALEENPDDVNISGALGVLADFKEHKISRDYLSNLFKGSSYLIENDFRKAIPYFEKALKEDPLSLDVLYNLGVAYSSVGEYGKAKDHLHRILVLNPGDAEAYGLLGTIYYLQGDFFEAKDKLTVAKKLFERIGDYRTAQEISAFLSEF